MTEKSNDKPNVKPAGRKGGSRRKINAEITAKLVEAIKAGSTYRLACQYAGIGHTTFYETLQSNTDFADIIKGAEASGAMKFLSRITDASELQWQAAAWMLERRHPEEYGKRVVEHSGQGGGAIQIKVTYDDSPLPNFDTEIDE